MLCYAILEIESYFLNALLSQIFSFSFLFLFILPKYATSRYTNGVILLVHYGLHKKEVLIVSLLGVSFHHLLER